MCRSPSRCLTTLRLREAVHSVGLECKFFQASTSDVFAPGTSPHNELSPFGPRSPYGTSKLHAHETTVRFRETHGLFAVCGILFNHESPRRGENFVTRKITKTVASIAAGRQSNVALGNLGAVRDWGYSPEYVEAMWLMLQAPEPQDFVLATGVGHSVRDFCAAAFRHAGLDWQKYVTHDERFDRPSESSVVIGDTSRARELLAWKADTLAMDVAALMVDADRSQLCRELTAVSEPLPEAGQ
jgi:GDPmannose 4,6-dehydratase